MRSLAEKSNYFLKLFTSQSVHRWNNLILAALNKSLMQKGRKYTLLHQSTTVAIQKRQKHKNEGWNQTRERRMSNNFKDASDGPWGFSIDHHIIKTRKMKRVLTLTILLERKHIQEAINLRKSRFLVLVKRGAEKLNLWSVSYRVFDRKRCTFFMSLDLKTGEDGRTCDVI